MVSTRIYAVAADTSKFAASFGELERIKDSSRNMGAQENPDITDIELPVSRRLWDNIAHLPPNHISLKEQAIRQAIQGKRISGLEHGFWLAEICATCLEALQ